MSIDVIWKRIVEFALMFFNFAMNEGENRFMIADANEFAGSVPIQVRIFYIMSFIIMTLTAVFASDRIPFISPKEEKKEDENQVGFIKVMVFSAAVFSIHTFYKMLIAVAGSLIGAQASIDASKCLGTYINPIAVLIYSYAVSTLEFKKGRRQVMFLGWALFLTPAVMTYSSLTREHIMLYIVAVSFGVLSIFLYQKCTPFVCFFAMSVLYFICKFFMIWMSEGMLILTADSWLIRIGQYLACVQIDLILTFILFMVLFIYKIATTEGIKLRIDLKRDITLVSVMVIFMVSSVITGKVVTVNAVELERPEQIYVEEVEDELEAQPVVATTAATTRIVLNNDPIVVYVITSESANIRTGPGTDYDVIDSTVYGTTFSGTGNEGVAPNGRTWYEIYIDDDEYDTGWVSSGLMERREILPINNLVGVWQGSQGSVLTLYENGECYYEEAYVEGSGTWEVDENAVLHVNTSAFSYEIYGTLSDGYDTVSVLMEADSAYWNAEVFDKES